MIRAVLDTNVLISALIFGGPPEEIIQRAGRSFELSLSERILDEAYSVLHYSRLQRYRIADAEIDAFLARLRGLAVVVPGAVEVAPFAPDPKDTPLLACALEAGADYLVTGDQRLLNLARYHGTRILSVRDFVESLG